MTSADPTRPRTPLNRERVLDAAVALADRQGIDALTMRNLASELDVEAMSLYHHVANKEALLDGTVDTIVGEIERELGGLEVTEGEREWVPVLRNRILTARRVMLRHPWAPQIIETRTTMTPTMLRYMESIVGIMIEGGCSNDLAHHAMHALGSRALGFNQELFVPSESDGTEEADDDGPSMIEQFADQIPYLVGMLSEIAHDDPDSTLGWCDDQTEFEFGLDILLEGIERRRRTA